MYLPDHAGTGRGHMGECLPCTIRVVTEVRAVTEETLAVRAVGPATLAPHTVSQVRVIVPTPRARGTVMVDQRPGPLGLCPVRGIFEVEQDSNIWLANTGTQPIQIDKDEVVALAECVLAEPGASAGSDRDVGDEVRSEQIGGASVPAPYQRGVPAVADGHGSPQTFVCQRKR